MIDTRNIKFFHLYLYYVLFDCYLIMIIFETIRHDVNFQTFLESTSQINVTMQTRSKLINK